MRSELLFCGCAIWLALFTFADVRAQPPGASDAFGRIAGESAVRLQVTPREAEVYVDGLRVGIVDDFDGLTQRLRLDAGEHTIELYAPGYRTLHRKVLVKRGETYRITYSMQPVAPGEIAEPPPPQPETARLPRQDTTDAPRPAPVEPDANRQTFGTLSVRVHPAGATVLVDGERWNSPEEQTRLAIDLAEGTHKVEIRLDGYRSYSTTIRVRRNEVTTLNVILPRQER